MYYFKTEVKDDKFQALQSKVVNAILNCVSTEDKKNVYVDIAIRKASQIAIEKVHADKDILHHLLQ